LLPDGQSLLCGNDNTWAYYGQWVHKTGLDLIDIKTGNKINRYTANVDQITEASFAANEREIMSRSWILLNWDRQNGTPKKPLILKDAANRMITAGAASADGRYLIVGNDYGSYIYYTADGRMSRMWDKSIFRPDFTPDGKMLFFSTYDRRVFLWDIETTGKSDSSPTGAAENNSIFAFLRSITDNRIVRQFPGHTGMINALAFSRNGEFILSGSWDQQIILWEAKSGKRSKTFTGHAGIIYTLEFSSDNKNFVSTSNDNTVRLWDIPKGGEIAQFISFVDGEWIVITPEGYFNASPGGAKHLNVRVGMNVYSIDNFYEKFFNPVYVASVLQGKKAEGLADIRRGIQSPPDVRIISPKPNDSFNTDTITIKVAAKDTGGGIDEIRLYHNGKALGDDQRGVKLVSRGGETVRDFQVMLVDGLNTFRAVGFSSDRTESNPYEMTVSLAAPSRMFRFMFLPWASTNIVIPR